VTGLVGTGRKTAVQQILEAGIFFCLLDFLLYLSYSSSILSTLYLLLSLTYLVSAPNTGVQLRDSCYVHNFKNPDMPKYMSLPAGLGEAILQSPYMYSLFLSLYRLPQHLNDS
jgi:hypothetical protein